MTTGDLRNSLSVLWQRYANFWCLALPPFLRFRYNRWWGRSCFICLHAMWCSPWGLLYSLMVLFSRRCNLLKVQAYAEFELMRSKQNKAARKALSFLLCASCYPSSDMYTSCNETITRACAVPSTQTMLKWSCEWHDTFLLSAAWKPIRW